MAKQDVTEEIVQKAKSGDRSAFDLLYREYRDRLYKYVIKLGVNEFDAEDVVSETFMQAIAKIDTLKVNAFFSTWLHTIAKNIVFAQGRADKKNQRLSFTVEDDDEINDGLDVALIKGGVSHEDTLMLPENYAESNEIKEILADTINGLNEDQREAIYLFYYEDMQIKDISEVTGASENTVKSRLRLAKSAIAKKVEELKKRGVVFSAVPISRLLANLQDEARIKGAVGAAPAAAPTVSGVGAAGTAVVSGRLVTVVTAAVIAAGMIGGSYFLLRDKDKSLNAEDISMGDMRLEISSQQSSDSDGSRRERPIVIDDDTSKDPDESDDHENDKPDEIKIDSESVPDPSSDDSSQASPESLPDQSVSTSESRVPGRVPGGTASGTDSSVIDSSGDSSRTVVPYTPSDSSSRSDNDSEITDAIPTHGVLGDNLTWDFDDNGVLTIKGTGEFYPPNSEISYYEMDNYFMYWPDLGASRAKITKAVFENGVTEIPDVMFCNHWELEELSIPESIETIGIGAFYYCDVLKPVTLPDSVITIGESAFSCCERMTDIILSNNLKEIGSRAFAESGLERIIIPDSVEIYGIEIFDDCKELKEVSLPSGLKMIPQSFLRDCSSLEEIHLPDSVSVIKEEAFKRCKALKNIYIPSSVNRIGDYAFYECPDLTVHTPAGSYAETYCKNKNINYDNDV